MCLLDMTKIHFFLEFIKFDKISNAMEYLLRCFVKFYKSFSNILCVSATIILKFAILVFFFHLNGRVVYADFF